MNKCAIAFTVVGIAFFSPLSAMDHENRRRSEYELYATAIGQTNQPATVATVVQDYVNIHTSTIGQVVIQTPIASTALSRKPSHDRLALLDERDWFGRQPHPVRPPTPVLVTAGGSTLSRSKADLPFYE